MIKIHDMKIVVCNITKYCYVLHKTWVYLMKPSKSTIERLEAVKKIEYGNEGISIQN